MRYFVQFAAGTGARCARRSAHADDSALVVDSSTPPSRVAALPYFKNAFLVLATAPRKGLEQSIGRLSQSLRRDQFAQLPGRPERFRVMAHVDGGLVPIKPAARSALERAVARGTGARLEPRGLGQEYWVVGRQDLSELLFCARLPKPPRPPTPKGAIASELAALLVAASSPTPQDRFLDPFAGSGAFVLARAAQPVRELWYADLELERHRRALSDRLSGRPRVRLLAEDALTLPSIPDGAIDVIVTDPPWGEHEELDRPYAEFAAGMAASLARTLHPAQGRYVVLVNRRNCGRLRDALTAAALAPYAEHDILVNGHPATVLIGRRCPAG